MKELKFRIWDKENDTYIYSEDFTEFYEFFEIPSYNSENECEQYTGLKDNNDVDIYEGDIVVGVSLPGGIRTKLYYDIIWSESTVGFRLNPHKTNIEKFRSITKGLTIVGNIHAGIINDIDITEKDNAV